MMLSGIYFEMFFYAPNISSSWKVRERTNKKKVRRIWPMWLGRHLLSHKNPTEKVESYPKTLPRQKFRSTWISKMKVLRIANTDEYPVNSGLFPAQILTKAAQSSTGSKQKKGLHRLSMFSQQGRQHQEVSILQLGQKGLLWLHHFHPLNGTELGMSKSNHRWLWLWLWERSFLCALTIIMGIIK